MPLVRRKNDRMRRRLTFKLDIRRCAAPPCQLHPACSTRPVSALRLRRRVNLSRRTLNLKPRTTCGSGACDLGHNKCSAPHIW
jgi:hypothetical protein